MSLDWIEPTTDNTAGTQVTAEIFNTLAANEIFLKEEMTSKYVTKEDLVNFVYPIGSIKITVRFLNPSTFLGGSWDLWGGGRVPVGVKLSDTGFNKSEILGGEQYHVLTESGMPSHTHEIMNDGSHFHQVLAFDSQAAGGTNIVGVIERHIGGDGETMIPSGYTQQSPSAGWHKHNPGKSGSDLPHNNMQPYITCYMWKRVR